MYFVNLCRKDSFMTLSIKLKSFLIAVVMIICSFSVSFTTSVYAQKVTIGYVTGTNVNVRADASTSSASLGKVSNFTVTVLGKKHDLSQSSNYYWYNVTYNSSGKTINGYIREDFVKIQEYELDSTFVSSLTAFPASYHNGLILLHSMYPEWTFTADKVPTTFWAAVEGQDYKFRKLIQSTNNSWRSMRQGCYDWPTQTFVETDSGGWYGASREVIAYYMDPRNFLDANNIFQYLQQSYDKNTQTVAGVEQIVDGTFLDATTGGKRYAEIIVEAAAQSSVSPYVLASTIIQEQGVNGSSLCKGSTYNGVTVYNFFNYGASGKDEATVINNGLKYAYDAGWTTPSAAIIGGAKKYGSGYINAGQDTYFYKNYNVLNPSNLNHQYAQNVADSLNSSKFLRTAYAEQKNVKLNFRIPVYTSMPDAVSALPAASNKLNNYYISNITVSGLTPAFSRYTYEYSLSISNDTAVQVSLPSGASLSSDDVFNLKKGNNTVKLAIRSQTGFQNVYTINVSAERDCQLIISATGGGQGSGNKGDTNGDGEINRSDLANVRLHLLKLITLKGANLEAADTNGDGEINRSDLANIRLHLLKLITLN